MDSYRFQIPTSDRVILHVQEYLLQDILRDRKISQNPLHKPLGRLQKPQRSLLNMGLLVCEGTLVYWEMMRLYDSWGAVSSASVLGPLVEVQGEDVQYLTIYAPHAQRLVLNLRLPRILAVPADQEL